MKKIINNPHDVVAEMVSGMTRSYPQFLTLKLLFAPIRNQ